MATFKSNSYSGRYLQLTITETTNTAANKSTLKWTLTSTGGSSTYYSIAPTTVKINGTTVYSKGATAWDDKVFPAAKGSVSGSIDVAHNSDGKKSVAIVFDTRVWYSAAESYGGTMTLTTLDRTAPKVSLNCSNITASSVKLSITSSVTANRWWYSLNGGSTWKEFNSTDGTKKETTVTGLTPNTSYSIQACARKKSNNVDGYSGKAAIKTLGASVISSVNTFTADAATAKLTLSVKVYNTSYTHTLTIKNGSTSVLTISNLKLANGSNTLTLTATQRSTVLNAMSKIKSFTGTFELKTFSGSTQIGSVSSKTATVQTTAANSAPTFTGFTYEDINATALKVTDNNQMLIQGISTLKITATAAQGHNGAKISSYSAVVGSAVKASTTTIIQFAAGAIVDTGTVPIIVTAVDSRGYTSAVTVNVSVIPYKKTEITTATMRRVNEVEAYSQVKISGSISPVTINEINKNGFYSMSYRYKKTSDETYNEWQNLTSSVTHNDNSFDFSLGEWLNLDAEYSYYVEIDARDKLSYDRVTLTIPQGTPLLSFRRKKVGINNRNPSAALDVKGEVIMNGFNVLGVVAALGNTEDLNNLTSGGIYTQSLNANASTDRHYPKAVAGFLEVIPQASGIILQRYTAYNNTGVYVRTRYNNTWNTWKSVTLTAI